MLILLQMTRSRVSLRGSEPGSPGSGESEEDSSDTKSPKEDRTPFRGRKVTQVNPDIGDARDTKA